MIKIGVTGAKNSGKTTLIEKLVSQFVKAGYSVATVKHTSHGHLFDTPGKDSYRHREAGAGMTLAISQKELALFAAPSSIHIQTVFSIMESLYDICFIEGDRKAEHRKIFITPDSASMPETLPANVIALYGPSERISGIPCFTRDDISGLVQFLTDTYVEKNQEAVDEHD